MIAGGRSQRMGVDKARVPFPERWPMAVHIARVLERCGLRTFLVRRGQPDGLPWVRPDGTAISVLYEVDGPTHPLRGVAHALEHCNGRALVVPCDVPWIDESVIHSLIEDDGVAFDGERVHPLCGVYSKARLADVQAAVAANASARSFAAAERRVLVSPSALRNLNRWSDASVVDPVQQLSRTLAFLSPRELAEIGRGERVRLIQRGVLCPGTSVGGAPSKDP